MADSAPLRHQRQTRAGARFRYRGFFPGRQLVRGLGREVSQLSSDAHEQLGPVCPSKTYANRDSAHGTWRVVLMVPSGHVLMGRTDGISRALVIGMVVGGNGFLGMSRKTQYT